jgi:serine/threonine protein kinase
MAESATGKDIITIGEKQFEVVGVLGKGGFGKVYKVVEQASGRKLAIKCIYQEIKEGTRMYNAIAGEIKVMQKLSHPGIIRLIGYNLHGVHNGQPCVQLVEELAPMCELLEYNIHCPNPFPEHMTLYIMKQVCDAVAFMHDMHIAHRDLKPQNILMDRTFQVKLADFGFAKAFMKREKQISMKSHLGTPGYMAPEISLRQEYTAKVDVFALGVVLFVCLSQRCPFKKAVAQPEFWYWDKVRTKQWNVFWLAHQRRHQFSDQQKDLLEKMLAADPNDRFDIYQVMEHPWFVDNEKLLPTKEVYVANMTKRYRVVRRKVQEEKLKARSAFVADTKDWWSVGDLLHNKFRKRFASAETPEECATIFAECAQLKPDDIMPIFVGQDLGNLKMTLTECTQPGHIQPYLPTADPSVLQKTWLRLNDNALVVNEGTNFANVKVFEELENAPLPVYGDGWGAPHGVSQFEVKIGFGTLVLMLKKFNEKTGAPVQVEPTEAKVVLSFPLSEEIQVGDEKHKVEDTLELAVSMFRRDQKTFVSITSHRFCFFNDQTPTYVDLILKETKLTEFAVPNADMEP